MSTFEVSALMKIREGQFEGFKKQAAEVIRVTKERDTRTLRYDWFLSEDGTECEIREDYLDSDGWLEHRRNIEEPLDKLFSEFAEAHTAFGYGDPSRELVEYATARMPAGSLKWYRLLGGPSSGAGPQPLIARPAGSTGAKGLEVGIRAKIREGQMAGLKEQAARCVQETRLKDTKTLRYDWFVSSDGAECETREAYVDSDGVLEHRVKNVADATNEVFRRFAYDPVVTVYGEASPELKKLATARMGGTVRWFSFLRGLDS